MSTLSSDEANQLWQQYLEGGNPHGAAALDRLYRALRGPLVAFCRLKGCDPELADEIAERTFIRLMVRKPRARRGFLPLLRKTAQNLCYDEFRRLKRSKPVPPGVQPAPAAGPETQDDLAAVRAALQCLRPEEAYFLLLVDGHGLTQRAACEMLGWRIAASTAHQRYARIRNHLERILKDKNIL